MKLSIFIMKLLMVKGDNGAWDFLKAIYNIQQRQQAI